MDVTQVRFYVWSAIHILMHMRQIQKIDFFLPAPATTVTLALYYTDPTSLGGWGRCYRAVVVTGSKQLLSKIRRIIAPHTAQGR